MLMSHSQIPRLHNSVLPKLPSLRTVTAAETGRGQPALQLQGTLVGYRGPKDQGQGTRGPGDQGTGDQRTRGQGTGDQGTRAIVSPGQVL